MPPVSAPAICDGLADRVDALTLALVDHGAPDAVLIAADSLIAGFDAGCQ